MLVVFSRSCVLEVVLFVYFAIVRIQYWLADSQVYMLVVDCCASSHARGVRRGQGECLGSVYPVFVVTMQWRRIDGL